MPIVNSEVPKARLVKGISASAVIAAGLLVLCAVGWVLYLLLPEIGSLNITPDPDQLKSSAKQHEETQQPAEPQQSSPSTAPSGALEQAPESPGTYDIGAYLTYGGEAFILKAAVARLSADRRRLAIGLFEHARETGKPPALAVMFEFHKPLEKCVKNNVKELALLFNLRPLGSIAAQRVQQVYRTQQEIARATGDFRCELKPGGRLDLHLLGASQTLLTPSGATLGWGMRLAQRID